jgi:hypothetical protein
MPSPIHITRIIPLASLCTVAAIGCTAAALAAPRHAIAPVGRCDLALRLSVSAPRPHHPSVRSYQSSSGSASCTGALGPWLMDGAAGWASGHGLAMHLADRRVGGKTVCIPRSGRGSIFVVVPRLAWFHPPRVTFSGTLSFHRVGSQLEVAGHGRLIPTREAPVSAPLNLAGAATFTPHAGRACEATRVAGTLTLEFVVRGR